jgi:DNA-binding NarL/FixJ family response regulator
MPSLKPIRILVADSHEMVRSALALFIDMSERFELVGEAEEGIKTLRLCTLLQPDVVLISSTLLPVDGFDTTRLIHQKHPLISIIMLSTSNRPEDVDAAIRAGVSSYLIKEFVGTDIIAEVIRAVAR